MFYAPYDFCSSFSHLSVFFWVCTFPSLVLCFFFFPPSFLAFLLKMARPNPTPTSTPNSTPTSTPYLTPSPFDYKSLFRWAPDNLLGETSSFTTLASIVTYMKSETCHKSRIFGREHGKFVRIVPCRVGEPVCYRSTVFKKLFVRLPFTGFERALLTEVNVTLVQLPKQLGVR